ncbi:MAG: glucosidase family protein [Sedimentisphaerales bacterium]
MQVDVYRDSRKDKLGMKASIAVEWKSGPVQGAVEITNGRLIELRVARGDGSVEGNRFSCLCSGSCRIVLTIGEQGMRFDVSPTMVSIDTKEYPFTFLLRDVRSDSPIFIPQYEVAVTLVTDERNVEQIQDDLKNRRLLTNLQRIEAEPEESYEKSAQSTRQLQSPVWLGLSRDIRVFEMGLRDDSYRQLEVEDEWIQPRFHCEYVGIEETDNKPCRYNYVLGRGWGCSGTHQRELDEGTLPILNGTIIDDDIQYRYAAFVSPEQSSLDAQSKWGTHFLVASGCSMGHRFTQEQKEMFDSLLSSELNKPEQTVLFFQCTASNSASVPRYAFFKTPYPTKDYPVPFSKDDHRVHATFTQVPPYSFEGQNGFSVYDVSDKVFCIAKLNQRPLQQEEMAVLLWPGEICQFEFMLPHRPISKDRAAKLAKCDFLTRMAESRKFWKNKLQAAGSIKLPEKRINNMVKAGLLHLDLITYGREPEETLIPCIGTYNAIGSESAPIIQFFDSMGWHDVARRSLMYFLYTQRNDGFMQNFFNYMLETGCVLWTLGEHYRYTRDDEWFRSVADKILKSCEFLINWRAKNEREDLRGKGYGMLEGQVADPEDQERIFMLNGYAYLGLSRAAEIFAGIDPSQSKRLTKEAEALKSDIRKAFFEAMAKGPVIPLGDGTWCPTASPWAGAMGPKCLFTDLGKWHTIGAFTCRDSLCGPLYLVFQEVINWDEPATALMLNYHNELMCMRNVAFSQPYYSRHDYIHLKRGEVKAFLKTYYNTFTTMADRHIYTFWELFEKNRPHKTHEEAWFLMQTRWMLYMEEKDTLKLLAGIPRSWLTAGQEIILNNVGSYFGALSLHVTSRLEVGLIEAKVTCDSKFHPKCVEIRLPHPQEQCHAASTDCGVYIRDRETVKIDNFEGHAEIRLRF